ncbi:hypothetical protein [Brevundimonas sp.]|uniref:hypothetical protein n=1 Tax=Brevundimonas sp. TaxID=1871086 RepID=UPI002D74F558|nr:hypothetical protein [Brevundimonas sp.]HYC97961.1 hypothetical protein [Brevundimonas sp.]
MKPLLFLTALIGLAACDTGVESRKEAVPPAERAAPAAAEPPEARPSGPSQTVRPSTDAGLAMAASVDFVQPLNDHGYSAKLISLSGGDPAANGNHLYLVFFKGPAEGHAVFPLGDFASWEVEQQEVQLVLKVSQDVVGPDGAVTRGPERRIIVGYAPGGPEATAPDTVTITPAR